MDLRHPLFRITVNEDVENETGLWFTSFVNVPATDEFFMAFAQQPEPTAERLYKFSTDEQRIVTGPAIVVDRPIYRNIDGQEFYVVFDRENTAKLVKKFARQQRFNLVTGDHGPEIMDRVFMFQSYIIDRAMGIHPPPGVDIGDGSWMLSYLIDNDQVWDDVKRGEFNGFSMEGRLKMEHIDAMNFDKQVAELSNEMEKYLTSLPPVTF